MKSTSSGIYVSGVVRSSLSARIAGHPNVVHLIEVFEDRHNLYAVMEKCDGGELFTRIVQKRQFSELEATKLCRDMLSAIEYCHSINVVHRDIKAENFLFSNISEHDGDSRLVLIDFGMSVQLIGEQPNFLKQMCGSPHYVAPELIQRYVHTPLSG